jgi:hypothetical protein
MADDILTPEQVDAIQSHALMPSGVFGGDSVTMEAYPSAGLQTRFSTRDTPGTACATIYTFDTPKSETSFSLEAQRYMSSVLGKELSDILGWNFEGRRVTCVNVAGVYGNDVLIISKKIRDKKASLEKYDQYSTQNGRAVIEYLPDQLAQRFRYAPTPVTTATQTTTSSNPYVLNPPCNSCQSASSSVSCHSFYEWGDSEACAAAQACYVYCQAIGKGDHYRLDTNSDGQACETILKNCKI